MRENTVNKMEDNNEICAICKKPTDRKIHGTIEYRPYWMYGDMKPIAIAHAECYEKL